MYAVHNQTTNNNGSPPTAIAAHALCSRCAEADGSQVAYYRDFISKECVECNASTFFIAPLTLFAVLLLALGVWLATSTKTSKIRELMDRKKATISTMRDQVGAHACVGFMIKGSSLNLHMPRRAQPSCYTTDTVPPRFHLCSPSSRTPAHSQRIPVQSTILVITYQIIIGLQEAHIFSGGSEYPSPFSEFIGAIEVLSFDMFAILHSELMDMVFELTHIKVSVEGLCILALETLTPLTARYSCYLTSHSPLATRHSPLATRLSKITHHATPRS